MRLTPRLVIVDRILPRLRAEEVAERLRETASTASIPVVALAAAAVPVAASTWIALSPAAVGSLRQLLPKLRKPGVTAVNNGYASTPGTAKANYFLSFERATAVAHWLEANGIPESALVIVGHGASDVIGPGASAANRRVLVVIEEA